MLDLGAGTAPATLDLFLSADLGVTVTTPEPPSVEAVYRFVRGLFQRTVRRLLVSDRFRMRLLERAPKPWRARSPATTRTSVSSPPRSFPG